MPQRIGLRLANRQWAGRVQAGLAHAHLPMAQADACPSAAAGQALLGSLPRRPRHSASRKAVQPEKLRQQDIVRQIKVECAFRQGQGLRVARG